jgi:hypothetical protein
MTSPSAGIEAGSMSNHSAFRYKYDCLPSELPSEVKIVSLDNPGLTGVYKGIWDTGATSQILLIRLGKRAEMPVKI